MNTSHTGDSGPKVWFRKVQQQHRLRVGAELSQFVAWLRPIPKSPLQCKGWVASFGQLQIAPELPHVKGRKKLSASLAAKPADVHEASSAWVAFARFGATAWDITCSFEPASQRFNIVLPEEPRVLNIVPNEGEMAAIFALGAILEVWRADNWIRHIKTKEITSEDAVKQAIDALDERD